MSLFLHPFWQSIQMRKYKNNTFHVVSYHLHSFLWMHAYSKFHGSNIIKVGTGQQETKKVVDWSKNTTQFKWLSGNRWQYCGSVWKGRPQKAQTFKSKDGSQLQRGSQLWKANFRTLWEQPLIARNLEIYWTYRRKCHQKNDMYVRLKDDNQHRIFVKSDPSDGTVLKTEMILWRISLHGLQNILVKPFWVNSLSLHPQMCVMTLPCEAKAHYVNNIQKYCWFLWAWAHLTDAKWKNLLWSDLSTFQVVWGNHGCRVLLAKEEKDHPDCLQSKVQVFWYGEVCAHGMMGDLPICEGTITADWTSRFWDNIWSHTDEGRPCLSRHHIQRILQQHVFVVRVWILEWAAIELVDILWGAKYNSEDLGLLSSWSHVKKRQGQNSIFRTSTISDLSSQSLTECY